MPTDHSVLESDSSSDSSIESVILRRAKEGDQAAFQRIVQLFSGLVYHWCRQSGVSPEDAEDIGQSVFVSVSRGLVRFQRDKQNGSFRGWLRTITKTRLADYFREIKDRELAQGGQVSWKAPTGAFFQDNRMADDETSEVTMVYDHAVALIRSEFSEQDFQAFHQVVIEGLSPREAAENVGVSVNSIYIAKSRILKRLRDEFGELLDDSSA